MSQTNLQKVSFSSDKSNPERNCDHYGKGELNLKFASSLEQLLAAKSDSDMGSKLLALPESLIALVRRMMDIAFTPLCTLSTTTVSFSTAHMPRRSGPSLLKPTNSYEGGISTSPYVAFPSHIRNVRNSQFLKRRWNPKIVVGHRHIRKWTAFNSPPQPLNNLKNVYILAPLRRNGRCRLPSSRSLR